MSDKKKQKQQARKLQKLLPGASYMSCLQQLAKHQDKTVEQVAALLTVEWGLDS
jgi:hypothetical protein